MRLNTTDLTNTIVQCFDFSMDGTISDTLRQKFLANGKRLRGQLVNLLTAIFDPGTQALTDANAQLDAVNQELADSAAVLADTVGVLNNISQLVSSLDGLVGVATHFI